KEQPAEAVICLNCVVDLSSGKRLERATEPVRIRWCWGLLFPEMHLIGMAPGGAVLLEAVMQGSLPGILAGVLLLTLFFLLAASLRFCTELDQSEPGSLWLRKRITLFGVPFWGWSIKIEEHDELISEWDWLTYDGGQAWYIAIRRSREQQTVEVYCGRS